LLSLSSSSIVQLGFNLSSNSARVGSGKRQRHGQAETAAEVSEEINKSKSIRRRSFVIDPISSLNENIKLITTGARHSLCASSSPFQAIRRGQSRPFIGVLKLCPQKRRFNCTNIYDTKKHSITLVMLGQVPQGNLLIERELFSLPKHCMEKFV
jgi:hypothetical protein